MIVYAQTLTFGLVYEDRVYEPIGMRPWPGMLALASETARTPARSLDRLLRTLSGPDPRIGHAVSLAVHLVNGWLLWLLARRSLAAGAALAAVAVFWLHPVQTEAVTYLAARGDLLVGTWVLLACLAVESRRIWLAACCAVLAITGKEMGVTAWLLVPLYAWFRGQRWSEPLQGAWAVGAILLGCLVLRGATASHVAWWASGSYVAGQITALGRLLLLWPEALVNPYALTIDHDWYRITAPIAWSGAAAFGLAVLALRGWWRLALLWSLCAALPRLVLPLLDGQHERHLYVTSIALSLATAALIAPKVPA